jgi:ADP-ribosyl-[dinitrogen reductase] hydrolase
MKTSLNDDPLRIAQVSPRGASGVIGLTLCPGKKDRERGWDRDLDIDVAAIRDWGAEVIVSLIETSEFEFLEVSDLPSVVERHGMRWVHLPIIDVSVPNERFEARWVTVGADLRAVIRRGGRVFVHCRGGLGRAGTIAARLLVELGTDPSEAIRAVKQVRPGAIETPEQRRHVLACRPISDDAD